jgi:hypothetical protein
LIAQVIDIRKWLCLYEQAHADLWIG